MTHAEAFGTFAAERYLLGEMREDERAAFEEHYFDCLDCADAVCKGALFIANLRAVLREEEQREN